jgi:hypothetical protein
MRPFDWLGWLGYIGEAGRALNLVDVCWAARYQL